MRGTYWFLGQLGSVKSVPIVTAAVAYEFPIMYQTYIVIFHQSVYIEELNSHPICPNQLRLAGITVYDFPLQFIPISKQSKESHTIQAGQLSIQLKLRGVINYFSTRRPMQREINDSNNYPHIEITSPATWDPYADHLGEEEHQLAITGINYKSHLQGTRFVSIITTNLFSISTTFDDDNLLTLFRNKVMVNATATVWKGTVTAKDLAEKWFRFERGAANIKTVHTAWRT
jgi:hypothetical protein